MLTYLLFILGFFILIKGADWLVEGASSIAKRLKVSSIVIGLTIVAFGTSAPEFIVNIFASINGNTEIAIGNILGSNIANVLLILGVSSIIYPLVTKHGTVWKEIPFSLLAALVLGILANDVIIDGSATSALTRIDGLVLIGFFIIFLYYTYGIARSESNNTIKDDIKVTSTTKSILMIIAGLVGLTVGGKWIVDGAVQIANLLNISQSLIGLTIVAVGTSLPELATSVMAAHKKESDIAIGNIVGSNIFNIFWILGFSAIIRPLPFSPSSILDLLMTAGVSLILFITMFVGKKHILERWQGVMMVLLYILYVIFLIISK